MSDAGAGAVRWFDSHCHLQDTYLPHGGDAAEGEDPAGGSGPSGGEGPDGGPGPLAGALERCRDAGVDRLVCVGTDPATSAQALALARASVAGTLPAGSPRIWASVGLHPHEASSGTDRIATMLDEERGPGAALVAVGECGLDYHYDHSPRPAQRAAFAEQVALAHRHGLALVIHARDAWSDLFDVLAAEGVPERTVLHCFTGGPGEARRCLDAGMFVSFSGIVTFKNAGEVREAAALCPLDRLLVETDAPFLAPVPHRGKPNEPSLVPLVGEAIAAVKGIPIDRVAAASGAAAARAFGS